MLGLGVHWQHTFGLHEIEVAEIARVAVGGHQFECACDGTSDFAVYRPATGVWYILRSSDMSYQIVGFGLPQDKPVPTAYQN